MTNLLSTRSHYMASINLFLVKNSKCFTLTAHQTIHYSSTVGSGNKTRSTNILIYILYMLPSVQTYTIYQNLFTFYDLDKHHIFHICSSFAGSLGLSSKDYCLRFDRSNFVLKDFFFIHLLFIKISILKTWTFFFSETRFANRNSDTVIPTDNCEKCPCNTLW